jgi:hypothetical protein
VEIVWARAGDVAELVGLINRAYAVGEAGLWVDDFDGRTDEAEIASAISAGQMLVARKWLGWPTPISSPSDDPFRPRQQPHYAASLASSARSTFSGVIGRSQICTPIASVTALAIAGIGGLAVISPTPFMP